MELTAGHQEWGQILKEARQEMEPIRKELQEFGQACRSQDPKMLRLEPEKEQDIVREEIGSFVGYVLAFAGREHDYFSAAVAEHAIAAGFDCRT